MAERMHLLLIAGYAGALALGAYELQRTPELPGQAPGESSITLPPLELPPEDILQIAQFDAIVERPLFSRERQPETTPVEAATSPQTRVKVDDITGLRLTAVLRDADRLTALLEDRSGVTKILHPGDQLGGWQLKEIQDDRVVMESDGRQETLLVHRFDPVRVKQGTIRPRTATPSRRIIKRPAVTSTPRPPDQRDSGRTQSRP